MGLEVNPGFNTEISYKTDKTLDSILHAQGKTAFE